MTLYRHKSYLAVRLDLLDMLFLSYFLHRLVGQIQEKALLLSYLEWVELYAYYYRRLLCCHQNY